MAHAKSSWPMPIALCLCSGILVEERMVPSGWCLAYHRCQGAPCGGLLNEQEVPYEG